MDVRAGVVRVVGVALAVVLAASLAGCSEDEEPRAGGTPKPATTSPTVTVSTPPADETAEEFIRRWFEVSLAFQNSGDETELMEISRDCGSCDRLVERLAGFYEAGGYVRTEAEEIRSVKHYSGLQYLVDTVVPSSTYKESAEGAEKSLPGGKARYLVTLVKEDGAWRFREMENYDG